MKYSRLIAGTMTWGQWGKQFSKSQMIDMMQHCLEQNITTFDHADIYGGYSTERDFGQAFSESHIRREDIQLISKCGIQLPGAPRQNQVKHYDYNKSYIINSVESSLKHLKTTYLDLLLLHRPSPLMQPEVIAEAFSELRERGLVKNFGVSNFSPSQVSLLSQSMDLSVNQIEFSLTHHEAMGNGSLDAMMMRSITPMAWSPLGHVFREDTAQTRRIHQQLGLLLDKYNASEDQLLLAWILKHPAGIHPVIGTTSKQRISDAAKSANITIELEDWFKILEASQGHEVP